MTDIEVHVQDMAPYDADADAEEPLRSLLRWVRADENVPEVQGRLVSGDPPAGAMGDAFELLQFAVGSGISVAALVVSILQWRDGLRRATGVVLRRGDVEIRLTEELARDQAALARCVAALDRIEQGTLPVVDRLPQATAGAVLTAAAPPPPPHPPLPPHPPVPPLPPAALARQEDPGDGGAA